MREFFADIRKPFEGGLRFNYKEKPTVSSIFKLVNIKPTRFGYMPYEPVVNILSDDVMSAYGLTDETFPFPQLFIGKRYNFVACADRIYYVNGDDWSQLYLLDTYDPSTGLAKEITKGNSWEFIDFYDTWFLTNGVCTVFGSAIDRMVGGDYKVYVVDSTPISTGVDFKGRVIFGGFDPKRFWNSTWQTFWDTWRQKIVDTGISPYEAIEGENVMMPVGENWVWWSSIGGGDVLFLFFPEKIGQTGVISSSYSTDDPIYFDILKKNEQGFAPLPYQGLVTAIRSVGSHLVALSEGGVVGMTPIVTPSPTFGFTELHLSGLANRGAVASNGRELVYIDQTGALTMIGGNLEATVLGYREFFYPMLGTTIIVSHAPYQGDGSKFGEFYISNGDTTYVLNEFGLFQTPQIVHSSYLYKGAVVGIAESLVSPDGIEAEIGVTVPLGDLPGLKTLEWVRIVGREQLAGSQEPITTSVAIQYRYKYGTDTSWNTTEYKKVNNEGVVFFPVTALEFRILVKYDDYEGVDIDYVEYGFKHGDKRYKRGIDISTAAS